MKYMLMMHTPKGGRYEIYDWPAQAIERHVQFMKDLNAKLTAAGEFVAGEGLAEPSQGKLIRAGKNGEATDGVFPESKEFLAGFWILDVETPERAYEIAAEISTAPGPDGKPLNMAVEVRQVMGG